jgi:hypothetical protein
MTHKALYINSPSGLKLRYWVKQLFTGGQNLVFLQKSHGIVIIGATPEAIYLKKRITGLAVGVTGVERLGIASRLSVEQEVNGVPFMRREILHGQVIPLGANRPSWHWWYSWSSIALLNKHSLGGGWSSAVSG